MDQGEADTLTWRYAQVQAIKTSSWWQLPLTEHRKLDALSLLDSDLRAVYKHYYSKQKIVEFWNIRLQRFGIPFAFANAGSGSDSATQRVQDILRGLQQESSAVFPMNVKPGSDP